MSIALVRASAQYLTAGTPAVTAAPLTMVLLGKSDSDSVQQYGFQLSDVDGTNRIDLQMNGVDASDRCFFVVNDGGGVASAASASGYTTNQWACVCGQFTSATDRRITIDGAAAGTNTTSRAPVVDRINIGSYLAQGGTFFSGNIALAAIWNVALSDAEVASLTVTAGIVYRDPRLVQPGALKHLWVFWKNSGYIDLVGSLHLTAVNSPTSDANMPVVIGSNQQNIFDGLF